MELADLDELDFGDSEFDIEEQLLPAPELDDLDDADNLSPAWLAAPVTEVLIRVAIEPDQRPRRSLIASMRRTSRPCPAAAGATASSRPARPKDAC